METRFCGYCGKPLPISASPRRMYCKPSHAVAASIRRKQANETEEERLARKQKACDKERRKRERNPERARQREREYSQKRRAMLREAGLPIYDKKQRSAYRKRKYAEMKADPERYAAYLARARELASKKRTEK